MKAKTLRLENWKMNTKKKKIKVDEYNLKAENWEL